MSEHRLKTASIVVSVIVAVAIAGIVWVKRDSRLRVEGVVPAFELRDFTGETVVFETDTNVKLVYFFYASCVDACPLASRLFKRVQNELMRNGVFGSDVYLYSVTVDPERDTDSVLKEYAKQFGAELSGWRFLRPEGPDEAKQAARAFNLDASHANGIMHTDIIVLVDQENRIRKRYFAPGADEIIKDIMRLL